MTAATVKLSKAQDRILVGARDQFGGHPIRDGREMRAAKTLALDHGFVVVTLPTGSRTIWGDAKITAAGREYLAKREAEKGLSQ